VNDALRDAFPVEVRHLFEEKKVFEDHWTAWSEGE
jgi:hypothetical protein